jgi:hypothetical protein
MPDWLTKPETVFAFGLFVVSIIVSLYAAEIRRWFRKPGQKLKEASLEDYRRDLAMLNRLHNNPYQLFLWALWSVLTTIVFVMWIGIAIGVVSLVIYEFRTPKVTQAPRGFWSIFITIGGPLSGAFIGRAFGMYKVVMGLYDYENMVQILTKRISSLEQRLGLPAKESITVQQASAQSDK